MLKTVSRYQVRYLNHKGDIWFFGLTIMASLALLLVRKIPGEPIANGLPIV